jgi:hypothetical protein
MIVKEDDCMSEAEIRQKILYSILFCLYPFLFDG